MSYRVIRIYSDSSEPDLAAALDRVEREGYRYVGSANRHFIMHKQEGPKHLRSWTMARIAEQLREAVQTDGGHHKQWYLEQIAEGLEVVLPNHDEGIAP